MTIMIMKVTKPQAVIRPFTSLNISVIRQRSSQCNKTASGNLAFHLDVPTSYLLARGVTKAQAVIWPFTWCGYSSEDHEEISNKTASGNLAFHPVARTRLTERA